VTRDRIITTCGDDKVTCGHKHIDPALCLYVGAYLICILNNEFLSEKVPRGNGTLCRLVSMKIKENATTHKCKKYYGKKVWTVCAKDVEWIECEHVIKTDAMVRLEKELEELTKKVQSAPEDNTVEAENRISEINKELINHSKLRRFKLEPQDYNVVVKLKPHHRCTTETEYGCRMKQFPVNLCVATTGHKLQGMSKDVIITWFIH